VRIAHIGASVVSVPTEAPLVWSLGVHREATRVIYELETDDGIVGVGESYFEPEVRRLVDVASEALAGLDVLATGALQRRLDAFSGNYDTMMPAGLRAGVEIACLDAAGKALGLPVSTLLGGAVRDRVECAAYLFYRERSADGRRGGELTPEALVGRAEELVERYGVRVLKLKGGVHLPEEDVRALRLLAERFPEAPLRLDPNGAWSVSESLGVLAKLRAEGIVLEYLEDPTDGLEGMAEVRRRADVALATNMCVVAFEHLAPAIRAGAVDIVLADPHYWGGLRQNQRMTAVCEAFGLGVGMHSDNDLGISSAAKVHLAAASPRLTYAIDSHHAEHVDDLIVEPLEPGDGFFQVPSGPGLGVELDREALARYKRA
jgi:glucarate dehydratase